MIFFSLRQWKVQVFVYIKPDYSSGFLANSVTNMIKYLIKINDLYYHSSMFIT